MKRLALLVLLFACAHAPKADDGARWVELTSDHFTLRTSLSEPEGRELLTGLEQTRRVVLQLFWPGTPEPAARMLVVALPEGALADAVLGALAGYASVDPFGQSLVVSNGAGLRGRSILNHELAHRLIAHYLARVPPWLNEGLASYLQTVRLDTGTGKARVGELLDKSFSSDYRGNVLPMGPEYLQLESIDLRKFEIASWALVHYLIDARREALNACAARLAHGEEPMAAFNAAFPDLDEPAIQRAMHDYTHGEGTFNVFELPLPQLEVKIESRALPQSEALATIASIYRKRDPAAVALAVQADPLNPLAMLLSGNLGNAKESVKAHPDDWRAHVLLWQQGHSLKELEKAAQLAPANAGVLAALSRARGRQGRNDEALALALQAFSFEPSSMHLETLAYAYAGKKRCPEALRAEVRAAEMVPEWASPAFRKGLQESSVDVAILCGTAPPRLQMAENEIAPDELPQRQSCGAPPQGSFKGVLIANYLVREDGSVADVNVTGKAATSVLRSFEKFIASCRYRPAQKDGKPIAFRMKQDLSR
jgi:tetratricopeptide (TPR) repeat protein